MSDVFLAGWALASSLGPDLATAIAVLREGEPTVSRVQTRIGAATPQDWPFHAIADDDADWWRRARRLVSKVAEDSGAVASPRNGALFVASSSIDIGLREANGLFDQDWQAFAEALGEAIGWRGPVYFINTACTSALNAMQSAAALIRAGDVDDALVLGVELRNRLTLTGFASMQLLSPTGAQPLGAGRDGLVLGEAVAALYLSRQASRWRIAGNANVVDGRNLAGAVGGAVEAMCAQVLARSGLAASDIGLVKLQAAGSPGNDAIELKALREVFRPLPALVSLKSVIGHTMGAAGAAEVALLIACIEAGVWPRVGYALDEALGAALIAATPREGRYLLASILGFGGGHAAVVLEDTAQR